METYIVNASLLRGMWADQVEARWACVCTPHTGDRDNPKDTDEYLLEGSGAAGALLGLARLAGTRE
jgi:hypothetical protein